MQTLVGRRGEAWITSARECTIGMTGAIMRTGRDVTGVVTDSLRATMAN
jgi:hypothetical protein